MPDLFGRRRAAVVAVAATTLLLALIPAGTVAKDPPRLADFMHGIAQVESGGRYTARNATTGAYGKYQIMPSNWPAWAKLYLGNAGARPTPVNQERVAKAKFTALWRWLGDWRIVAHWWLTGSKDPNIAHWTPFSRRYVNNVISLMGKAPPVVPPPSPPPPVTPPPATNLHVYQETSSKIAYSGAWSAARARGYAGGAVRYATAAGATARIVFVGTSVSWVGPVGPTRGRAEILVDGAVVARVDLFSRGFIARKSLFSTSWSTAGSHTLVIRVVGTAGRPMVAIDELLVHD